MVVTDFFKNTIDIIEKQRTTVNWESNTTDNPIYTDIPCHYYSVKDNINDDNISRTTEKGKYKCMVDSDKINARDWYFWILKDPDLWTIGKFIISWTKANRLKSWIIDHISFFLERR